MKKIVTLLSACMLTCAASSAFAQTLVVFYSWGGNTKAVAQSVQKQTGSDIYEIKTVRVYPADPHETALVSMDERRSGRLPEIAGDMPDFSKYDAIFLGGPVWNGHTSTPLARFLQKADFQGSPVVAFWTDQAATGGYEQELRTACRNAKYIEGRGFTWVARMTSEEIERETQSWLKDVLPQLPKP